MDKQKITSELATLLNDEDRDFLETPITNEESQALILCLFTLIGDPKIPEEDATFYLQCLEVVKANTIYQ